MIDYKQLYLDDLKGTVDYGDGPRSKVRCPEQYAQFSTSHTDWEDYVADNVWLSSDLHFGHGKVIQYSNRPFKDAEEMNDALISHHNAVVSATDTVIFLGDLAFESNSKADAHLSEMYGEKHLVVGNHDMVKRKVKPLATIKSVQLLFTIRCEECVVLFTHFPIDKLPKFDNGLPIINVHGHTHAHEDQSIQHINVSTERTNYAPIKLTEVINKAKSRALEILG